MFRCKLSIRVRDMTRQLRELVHVATPTLTLALSLGEREQDVLVAMTSSLS